MVSSWHRKNSRKVIQYGWQYDYKSGNTRRPAPEIPSVITKLIPLIYSTGVVPRDYVLNQCIINKYLPGQGISAHIDHKDYGEFICCFTIGHGTIMEFTKGSQRYPTWVGLSSLYIMSGPARWEWRHEMPVRLSDQVNGIKHDRGLRYSITFRALSN